MEEENKQPIPNTAPIDPVVPTAPSAVPVVEQAQTPTVPTTSSPVAPEAPAGAPEPLVPVPEHQVLVHTYDDDLARSMNVSDAKVVQELLTSARERESVMKEEVEKRKARGWYTTGAIILILAALAAATYGAYHYTRLTVPVTETVSIGVWASTPSIDASTTTIESVLSTLQSDTTLIDEKPYLVDLVADQKTNVLLNNTQLFSFIGAAPTEPFATSLGVVRLGIMNTASDTVPFLIASLPNPEIANKEFLIAEQKLLPMFFRALNIDTTTIAPETNPEFVGEYRYNLPVRALYTTSTTGGRNLTLLYGSVTDNIIVLTTKPEILKAIYDTIIRQQ
ncbi:MAG TPA: hypothetical protein VGE18_03225 [Candidatus Paceibacterota bacterium]